MRIGIYGNVEKKEISEAAQALLTDLNGKGFFAQLFLAPFLWEQIDVLVVLGGDGTILHIAAQAAQNDVKIVGVNYGTLGFLTEFEREEIGKVSDFLFDLEKEDCRVLKRSVLEVVFEEKRYYALNEAAVQRDYAAVNSRIMRTEVSKGEDDCIVFCGDGALIATPTGSTAYSLSAGGAIAEPDAPVMMLTPVCSFSLNARCVVISDQKTVTLSIEHSEAALMIDGKMQGKMKSGDCITVKKAPFYAEFPVRSGSSFFQKVSKKLK